MKAQKGVVALLGIFLSPSPSLAQHPPAKKDFGCSFERRAFDNKFILSYCISGDDFHFLVQAETAGWVGVGFTDAAKEGWEDADIVMGYVDSDSKRAEVQDAYSTTSAGPAASDLTLPGGSYDLVYMAAWEEDG